MPRVRRDLCKQTLEKKSEKIGAVTIPAHKHARARTHTQMYLSTATTAIINRAIDVSSYTGHAHKSEAALKLSEPSNKHVFVKQ